MDYAVAPTNIEYMLNNYSVNSISGNSVSEVQTSQEQHLQYTTQNSEVTTGVAAADTAPCKEVPQVSW